MWSVASKSAHGASPSRMPHAPAVQRPCSARAPRPSGVTAPTPVMTTSRTGVTRPSRRRELEPTDDVLAALSRRRREGQTLVGFAAEHGEGAVDYGRGKLERKRLDLVVVN